MEGMLRTGVFYDGSHFNYAQNFFYGRKLGWLSFKPFHTLLEQYLRKEYKEYLDHKIVYVAWYQGLFSGSKADDKKLRLDRSRHQDLLHAGIETKFHPMSQSQGEKGIDVAMAIDIFQIGLDGMMDMAVLVTGDDDFVPLARALMKRGIRVMVVYFEYEEESGKRSFCNERLKEACNHELNINALETNKEFKTMFKTMFKKYEVTDK